MVSSCVLPYLFNYSTLSHLVPARPFATFSRTTSSTMAGNLFFGMFLSLCCRFNFLISLFVLNGYLPSSALSAVVLVVLEHHRSFLACVVCTVSNCFTSFAFPSHHTPRPYSSSGAFPFIRIHVVIQLIVSRCESVRIASILPTCA